MTGTPRCTHAPQGAATLAAERAGAAVPRLETERLRLRALRMRDLPAWTEILCGADLAHVGGPHDAETAWEAFSIYASGWLLHGHGLWTVERRADGTLLGFVHLGLEWDDEEPELGWMFLSEHRGQGYAAEAARAARDHGLRLLGAGRFVSYVAPGNGPSNRLAERIGGRRDAPTEAALRASSNESVNVWRHGGPA